MFLCSGVRLACCDGIANAFAADPSQDPSPPPNPPPPAPAPTGKGGKSGKKTSSKKKRTAGTVRQEDGDATTTMQGLNKVESGAYQYFWSYTTIALMGMVAIIL
jgi:hypothetical protein